MKNLKILQWNMRGFKSQKSFLQHAIDQIKPQVICVQETHAKPNNNLNLGTYQYPPIRLDRTEQRGGGIAIFIHNTIPYTPITINTETEVIATNFFINNRKITICNMYLPPNLSTQTISNTLIDKITPIITGSFILTMDANSHHISWGSPNSDAKGKIINDWINQNELVLLNNGDPTYLTSTGNFTHIDLTICSPDIAAELNWSTYKDTLNSDYYPIIIEASSITELENNPQKWKTQSANWNIFQEQLKLQI